jgi:hypothetical protein
MITLYWNQAQFHDHLVLDNSPPVSITSAITASVQVGTAFHYTIASSGGTLPIGYSASPLPAGLSADAGSGEISGTPAETGTAKITIGVTNSAGGTSRVLTLTVTDTPPTVSIGAWRMAHFGASATDPLIAGDMADPDGDGYTNLQEFNAGSDPLDRTSVPGGLALPHWCRAGTGNLWQPDLFCCRLNDARRLHAAF